MATNYQVSTLLTARNMTGPAFARMAQSAKMAYAAVDRIKGGLVAVAGISGSLAGIWAVTSGAAVRMTADVAAASAAITDLSNASGVSQEALERLMNAGRMQGADIAALSKGVKRLALDMADYKDATSSQYKALKEINPALAEQMAATTGTQEALELVTGAMLDATEAQRLQIAEAVFGKQAADDYALALGMTREEFRKLQQRMDKFNPPNTKAQSEAFASLDDSLEETRAAWDGTQKAFASGVAPGMKTALDSLNGWLVSNRGQIEGWGQSMGQWIAGIDWDNVARMVQMVMDVFKGGLAVVDGMASAFGSLADMVGGADRAMIALIGSWAAFKAAGVANGIAGMAGSGAAGGAAAKRVGARFLGPVGAMLGVGALVKYGVDKYASKSYDMSTTDGAVAEAMQNIGRGGAGSRRGRGLYVRAMREGADVGQGYIRDQMQRQGIAPEFDTAALGNSIGAALRDAMGGALEVTVKVAVEGGQLVGTGVTKGAAVLGNVGVTGVSGHAATGQGF
jgi:hypothetical protein